MVNNNKGAGGGGGGRVSYDVCGMMHAHTSFNLFFKEGMAWPKLLPRLLGSIKNDG